MDFLERHGTVVILSALLLIGLGATFYVGLHAGVDKEKLFAFFGGYTMGVFSALTLSMKVNPPNGPKPA